jgi:hypothetical protein
VRIARRENAIKGQFLDHFDTKFKTDYFVMQHQDMRKAGGPDISIHGNKRSTLWEFKHATPLFDSHGIQELTCMRLALRAFFCAYVVFFETEDQHSTYVLKPSDIYQRKGSIVGVTPIVVFNGFDFEALSNFIHHKHTA